MMKEAVLAILALLVVSCQMKTLLVKTKSKGGDDYNLQKNTGSVGGNMFQGRGSGNFQGNSGSVAGNMVQDYNLQKNTGIVGGNMLQGRGLGLGNNLQNNGGNVGGSMIQGRGSGNFQGNSGSVAGDMVQDYNLQKNTGSVGGSMLQGRGSGFGNNVQNNGGSVGGSMFQSGGSSNFQGNSGSVAGNMVQDYEAKVSCKTLVARMKNCKRKKGEEVPPKCVAILKRFAGQKCRFKGADGQDYQFTLGNIGNIQCSSQVCTSNSRDYANALQIGCCSHQ